MSSRNCWVAIIAWKLVTIATWLLLLAVRPELSSPNRSNAELEEAGVNPRSMASAWMAWDAASYQRIAVRWYERSGEIKARLFHAHYPLLPALLRFTFIFTGPSVWVSVILCQIIGMLALRALYEGWRLSVGEDRAICALWLFCAYPWSMFMELVYTEGITILLLAMLLIACKRENLWLACICALLLPGARPTGHLIIPALAAYAALDRKSWRWVWPVLAACAGAAGYFLVMYWSTGEALAGFTAQQYYPARGSVFYLFNPMAVWRGFINVAQSHYMHKSPVDRAVFIVFLVELSLLWYRKPPWLLGVWTALAGIVPALSNLFFSFARFHLLCLIAFPWLWRKEGDASANHWRDWVLAGFAIKALLLWRYWVYLWAG